MGRESELTVMLIPFCCDSITSISALCTCRNAGWWPSNPT